MLSEYSMNEKDPRDIYDAFHGLFTVTKRVEVFNDILSDHHLPIGLRREILARFCDMGPRYNTGLQTLPIDDIYTDLGKSLLYELNGSTEEKLGIIKETLDGVDFSNRKSSRFDYMEFLEVNSIDKYLS